MLLSESIFLNCFDSKIATAFAKVSRTSTVNISLFEKADGGVMGCIIV